MANAWLAHVKKTMRAHKGQKFSAILKLAKKSYKKHRGGESPTASVDSAADKKGADDVVPDPVAEDSTKMPPVGGRRRRSSRRTRRHRRR